MTEPKKVSRAEYDKMRGELEAKYHYNERSDEEKAQFDAEMDKRIVPDDNKNDSKKENDKTDNNDNDDTTESDPHDPPEREICDEIPREAEDDDREDDDRDDDDERDL